MNPRGIVLPHPGMRVSALREEIGIRVCERQKTRSVEAVNDSSRAEILGGEEISRRKIESKTHLIRNRRLWIPAPRRGKKIDVVIIADQRYGTETCVKVWAVHKVAIPVIGGRKGIAIIQIVIDANSGVVSRVVVALVELIAQKVDPIPYAIVVCSRRY